MSSIPTCADILSPTVKTYSLGTVSKKLGVSQTRVIQLLRDGHLLAIRRDGDVRIPTVFFDEEDVVHKHVPGVIALLRDGGYSPNEILRWLFTPVDDLEVDANREATTLRPVEALHTHNAREVMRRAQAMAF